MAANQVADLRAIIIIDNSFIDDDNYIKINDEITKYPVMTFVTTPGAKATGLPQVLHLKLYSPTVIIF